MKEKNLYQVIEKAKKEMVLFGYSKSSINEYNIIFAELLNYFNNQKI